MADDRKAYVRRVDMAILPDRDPDTSYLYQSDPDFAERRAQWERGEFGFVGVRAVATIAIPDGAGAVLQTIESPGLWNVEDDSSEEHFAEVYAEELDTLRVMLAALHLELPEAS